MAADSVTLREIDLAAGRPKGSAFRAFKALAGELREGADFRVLTPETDAAAIDALRGAGRIYAGSRNVVLLAADAAARVRRALTG